MDKRHRAIPVLNDAFTIPAGEKRHEIRASYTVPPGRDMHATGITPHMHLLGREMKVTATYPDGTVRPLVYIDDWDFHWQANYTFEEPVPLPGGTRIDMVAVFDNSAELAPALTGSATRAKPSWVSGRPVRHGPFTRAARCAPVERDPAARPASDNDGA